MPRRIRKNVLSRMSMIDANGSTMSDFTNRLSERRQRKWSDTYSSALASKLISFMTIETSCTARSCSCSPSLKICSKRACCCCRRNSAAASSSSDVVVVVARAAAVCDS